MNILQLLFGVRAGSDTSTSRPTNPFRKGATVLIAEDPLKPEYTWSAVVLSNRGGYTLVRDLSSPYQEVTVHSAQVFPYDTRF